MAALDRVSIEVTNRCAKACTFCYAQSHPDGPTRWTPNEVVAFCEDLARHGVTAVSFGGGEPLEYDGLFEVLVRLQGTLLRSFTTNGLLLDERLDAVVAAAPDKVHVSIHAPGSAPERMRVARQVAKLADRGVPSGVNLVVAQSRVAEARDAVRFLAGAGVGADRLVLLPMRGADTPTPAELARVAGGPRFQSMTCLPGCAASPRFASVDWARRAAWCSYTRSRRELGTLDHAGLVTALRGLGLETCAT